MKPLLLSLLLTGMAAAQTQGSATIRDNDRTLTLNCTGANDVITVRGNNNTLTLNGTCENLVVYGNGNRIAAWSLVKVWLRGNGNVVTATQQTTASAVSNTGNGNRYTIGTLTDGAGQVNGDRDDDRKGREKEGRTGKDDRK